MKILLNLAFLISVNSFASIRKMPILESKMWNFLIETQVSDNKIIRTKGGWPSFSRFKNTNISSQESNSFVTSQILVSISKIRQYYDLPAIDLVSARANHFLDLFLFDALETNEPAGTIAYWPLLETPNGIKIRSFSTKIPYRNLSPFNVPNDLDASANYFMWLYNNKSHSDFLKLFENTVGNYVDLNRKIQYFKDYNWKELNSGAFLTWVDPDKSVSKSSRIFKGVNDVDCVVNLNILTALLTYKNNIGNLTENTNQAVSSSCLLINKVIENNSSNRCGVWYDRKSQFFTAYSKTYEADFDFKCLGQSSIKAKEEILKNSRNLILLKNTYKINEVAEYISVIKKIWTPNDRTEEIERILKGLEEKLKSNIVSNNNFAYLDSEDSLFIARIGPITIEWFSKQYSTAIALEALLLP